MLWRHAATQAAALTVGAVLLLTGCSSITVLRSGRLVNDLSHLPEPAGLP
jgi:hypothetical protein